MAVPLNPISACIRIGGMVRQDAAASTPLRISPWPHRTRWLLRSFAIAVVALCAGCGVQATGSGFPNPPHLAAVGAVLVSADGRVLTGVGGKACGYDPKLVARLFPDKVTLTWLNPHTNCDAETLLSAVVHTTLPDPLGDRPLVQASGGRQIPYFDERDLARVTVLPPGYRLRGDYPAGQPAGDTRTYTWPPGAGTAPPHGPCSCAQLVITQQVLSRGFIPPTRETSQRPVYVRVHSVVAALLDNGPDYARSVNWAEHGYYFTVAAAFGPKKVPLTDAQLIAVARGLQLPSGAGR
jgi:hypothetical protein